MTGRVGLHWARSGHKGLRRPWWDASGYISLSRRGCRGTADEGVLANPGAVDSGPVVHAGPRVELDCPARVIADIGSWPARTSPGGLGAGATEGGPGHDENDEGPPPAVRHSPSEEKTTTTRRVSPPRRTSAGPIHHRESLLGRRQCSNRGSPIPPSITPARRRPQPFNQTMATGPSDATSAAMARPSRTSTDASRRSSARMPSRDPPPKEPSRTRSAADVDAAEIRKVSPSSVVSAQIGRFVTARSTPV